MLSTDVVTKVAQENMRRSELNTKNEKNKTMDFAVPQPTTTVAPSIRSTEAATEKGGSGGGGGKANNNKQSNRCHS